MSRFARHFARCKKRDRPSAAGKWHLDEVFVPINGVKMWLWRAVDGNGDVLDILVQPRRNAKAASRFLRHLIARFGQPHVIITDKLRSCIKPIRQLAPDAGALMRLCELSLEFFGHFAGKTFDFGDADDGRSDFHVIHGPNEAGKTTAMEGYLRLLYGFAEDLDALSDLHGRSRSAESELARQRHQLTDTLKDMNAVLWDLGVTGGANPVDLVLSAADIARLEGARKAEGETEQKAEQTLEEIAHLNERILRTEAELAALTKTAPRGADLTVLLARFDIDGLASRHAAAWQVLKRRGKPGRRLAMRWC